MTWCTARHTARPKVRKKFIFGTMSLRARTRARGYETPQLPHQNRSTVVTFAASLATVLWPGAAAAISIVITFVAALTTLNGRKRTG